MKLRNNFSDETRGRFVFNQYCQNCGSYNMPSIHHIAGRVSDSPYNAIVLCHDCHAKCGHSVDEETKYFTLSVRFHTREGYVPKESDQEFINSYPRLKKVIYA